jgi:hypothetical protein
LTRRHFSRAVAREAKAAGLPLHERSEAVLFALRLWDEGGDAVRRRLIEKLLGKGEA